MGSFLALNAGSSSLKFALFRSGDAGHLEELSRGCARSRGKQLEFSATDAAGPSPTALLTDESFTPARALTRVLDWLGTRAADYPLTAVGHRVVHGGDRFPGPVMITLDRRQTIGELSALAPLHQPFSLACIDAVTERYPTLPQVACFDTSFHQTLSPVARLQPLPADLRDETLLRYGFHGLSYESVATSAASLLNEAQRHRIVIAHLGSGASLCALRHGMSVDTTMGFSALDGLVMGTRPGALDAGLVLHLLKTRNLSPESLEEALYKRAGLLGISRISNDMETLLASDTPDAALAVDYFVYRAAREIGAMTAVLGGIDTLVFTGGIGENSAEIRRRISHACSWLGLALNEASNEAGAQWLSCEDSAVAILRVATDEERVIAEHTAALVRREDSHSATASHGNRA